MNDFKACQEHQYIPQVHRAELRFDFVVGFQSLLHPRGVIHEYHDSVCIMGRVPRQLSLLQDAIPVSVIQDFGNDLVGWGSRGQLGRQGPVGPFDHKARGWIDGRLGPKRRCNPPESTPESNPPREGYSDGPYSRFRRVPPGIASLPPIVKPWPSMSSSTDILPLASHLVCYPSQILPQEEHLHLIPTNLGFKHRFEGLNR
ncbi:hypothetical protein NDU88_006745 [Pleurodeles waltl]|uniref:Uncharacterized protein n=1 Tax=Pleurodeles waltl TaxID=8319 RepID=A0AAV7U101_PLEWA|nr:hypothetical protein NDU88_006745 [Pleurodeles waltl]